MQHAFTTEIQSILRNTAQEAADDLFGKSELLQYLNIKTKSANRGSKSRGSFANLYAIYVLVEDYLQRGFDRRGQYSKYVGAKFSILFQRQRRLPFGSKLQNHALNHRLNEEFHKYFPNCNYIPIIRNTESNKYWFNENLLKVSIGKKKYNIAAVVIEIIEKYLKVKQDAFKAFIKTCEQIQKAAKGEKGIQKNFIVDLIAPNADARIFEIVSFAILKYYFYDQVVYFGFDPKKLAKERLLLYKTGRTNANDGGIDFVMRPLGRFFQVTETLDAKKYFLDIDKIERFPISFVIKSMEPVSTLTAKLRESAMEQYSIEAVVEKYMGSIEEIINVPLLLERFSSVVSKGHLNAVFQEIIRQSRTEFNMEEDTDDEDES